MQAQMNNSRKLLRNIVILILLTIYSYYFYTYLEKLLKGQVGTSVIRQPKTQFDFPSITICGHVSDHELQKPWVLYAEAQVQENDDPEVLFLKLWPNETDQGYKWTNVIMVPQTGLISCDKFTPKHSWKLIPGLFNEVKMLLDTRHVDPYLSFLFIVVGDKEEAVDYRTLSQKFNVVPAREHDKLDSGLAEYTFAALDMGAMVTMNQKDSPCDEGETNNKAYHNCLEKYVEKRDEECKIFEKNGTTCDPHTKWKVWQEILIPLQMGPKKGFDLTGCMPPCTRSTYEVSLSRPSVVPVLNGTTADMILHFYIPEPIYTLTEEFLVYDFESFMADLAGMFGILLGVSLLAVYDMFCATFLDGKKDK